MEIKTIQATENAEPDWEFLDYALSLEKQWKDSRARFTDKELVDIFPEAKNIIPLKIREWEQVRHKITNSIKTKLLVIKKQSAKEHQWFWREVVKYLDGQRLVETQGHLVRLRRQLALARNDRPKNGAITDERIQRAIAVPLVDIAMRRIKLSKGGKTFFGLCPFHNERRPSFHIYHANNSFYCFGCQKGGNVITFVRELEGLSFREAIKYLTQ
ncbi:MAG: hypothetical protein A3C93_05560 [Candidatus Lloydbacteria bacterium RIFCSPHIGHO2_02_FULL_54_17]|uniref:Zinc finger CHC2-type domain-containing protein n=1 Tax=Candidatus Lloydbacteria bacterium RIFCSPHIGHO2_02_FULL_54_17 TaxID=1798664 RepID=A0A1G2DAV4_9BACT|nr:MAG: hypothetical protein A3C93_05560 [Candidatus Lloydbacteria bacterium RIFCSPHIGHO2_02_FULL_54_17]OGZ13055.1 MAG: hypothetical protein A2948_03540 [Candidatus Lloydbacteria bacterium RIFCSPLOWO2_01_FULL_54_18]